MGAGGYIEVYAYDEYARPISKTQIIDEKSHTTTQIYDRLGRVAIVVYPSNFAIKNTYNDYGYLDAVVRLQDGHEFWSTQDVDARGIVVQSQYGNEITHVRMHNQETTFLERITSTKKDGTLVQDKGYRHDIL